MAEIQLPTPKFELGKDVYFMSDNEIRKERIMGVLLKPVIRHLPDNNQEVIKYTVKYFFPTLILQDERFIDEAEVFSTKEELLVNLASKIGS